MFGQQEELTTQKPPKYREELAFYLGVNTVIAVTIAAAVYLSEHNRLLDVALTP